MQLSIFVSWTLQGLFHYDVLNWIKQDIFTVIDFMKSMVSSCQLRVHEVGGTKEKEHKWLQYYCPYYSYNKCSFLLKVY